MVLPSSRDRRVRVKLGDLVFIDHDTGSSSGTEESYLISSDGSQENKRADLSSVAPVPTDFLSSLSADSQEEKKSLPWDSDEEPLLRNSGVATSSPCSCMPIFRRMRVFDRARWSHPSQMDEIGQSNGYRPPYRPVENRNASSKPPTQIEQSRNDQRPNTESLTSDSSGDVISEGCPDPDVDAEPVKLRDWFTESRDDENSVVWNSPEQPLLKTEAVSSQHCSCLPNNRAYETNPNRVVNSKSKHAVEFPNIRHKTYNSFEDHMEVHAPVSEIVLTEIQSCPNVTLTSNEVFNHEAAHRPRDEKDMEHKVATTSENQLLKRSAYVDEELHHELDQLIDSVRAPALDTMRMPLDYQLSTLYEEDEEITTQSTPSKQSLTKAQKLAEYLKRDGETYFDYGGLSVQPSLESSSSEDEEIVDHILTRNTPLPTNPIERAPYPSLGVEERSTHRRSPVLSSDGHNNHVKQSQTGQINLRSTPTPELAKAYRSSSSTDWASICDENAACSSAYGAGDIIFPASSEEISELTEELSPVVALLPDCRPNDIVDYRTGRQIPSWRCAQNQNGRYNTPDRHSPLWKGCSTKTSASQAQVATPEFAEKHQSSVHYRELAEDGEDDTYSHYPTLMAYPSEENVSLRTEKGGGESTIQRSPNHIQAGAALAQKDSLARQRGSYNCLTLQRLAI